MPRRMFFRVLLAIAVLGVGALVLKAEFSPKISGALGEGIRTSGSETGSLDQQQRAERESENQAISSACAALRQMGRTDKDCSPQ